MNEAIAWFQNNPDGTYIIWYDDPTKYGVQLDEVIPLFEGWEETFKEIESSLNASQSIRCSENGEFEIINLEASNEVEMQVQESIHSDNNIEDATWSQIADALRQGINSV